MNDNVLRHKITQAVSLDREIAEQTELLKAIKAELIIEARSREDQHQPTDGGGTTWSSQGVDGCAVTVAFPSPSLRSKIDGEAKGFDKIKAAAGKFFDRLLVPVLTYRPITGFRDEAQALLGKPDGRKLIKLCESATTPRVSFETKEAA
jgi:hypothetical protein